jgi:hypothetical protein
MQNYSYIEDYKSSADDVDTRFKDYMTEFETDLPKHNKGNPVSVADEVMKLSSLRHKYQRHQWDEEQRLFTVETEHKKITKVLKKYYFRKLADEDISKYGLLPYLENDDFGLAPDKTKNGVDEFMQADDLYRAVTTLLGKQANIVTVIKSQISFLNDRAIHVATAAKEKRHNEGSY